MEKLLTTNKVSQRPDVHPIGKHMEKKFPALPVITTCKVVTYKRIGMSITVANSR